MVYRLLAATACVALLLSAAIAAASPLPDGGSFSDDDGNVHEPSIEAIAAEGITRGCNPPVNDFYCPSSPVTRGQMAAFLVRALDLTEDGGGNTFIDDDGSTFEDDIAKLAAAGITRGCNPPENTMYCPEESVTRGQMAAFLVRAMGYTNTGVGDLFVDDDGSTFETDIDRLGTAGVTKGCNPPENTMYCPSDPVRRDQMASFLARALELPPIVPTTSTTSTTSSTTSTSTSTTTSTTSTTLPPPPSWRVSEIVSVSTAGVQGNADSGYSHYDIAVSGDGRFVVFTSEASNLVEGDDNFATDVFVRDRLLGITERVGTDAACCNVDISQDGRFVIYGQTSVGVVLVDRQAGTSVATGCTSYATISSDGSWVVSAPNSTDLCWYNNMTSPVSHPTVFTSLRPPSISGDGNLLTVQVDGFVDQPSVAHVAVHDFTTGTDELISVNNAGTRGNKGGIAGFISSNGRWVVFASQSTNLDPADTIDDWSLYLRDRVSQTTTYLPGASFIRAVGISDDGRWITTFDGEIYDRDAGVFGLSRYDTAHNGQPANETTHGGSISLDGTVVAVASTSSNLVASDGNLWGDAFVSTFGDW